jgi:hypothetical protein
MLDVLQTFVNILMFRHCSKTHVYSYKERGYLFCDFALGCLKWRINAKNHKEIPMSAILIGITQRPARRCEVKEEWR